MKNGNFLLSFLIFENIQAVINFYLSNNKLTFFIYLFIILYYTILYYYISYYIIFYSLIKKKRERINR